MDGRYEVSYIGPRGKPWELTSGRTDGVFMEPGGVQGLVGAGEDVTVSSPFSVGQVLDGVTVGAMDGTLTVTVTKTEHASLSDVWAEFRADFSRTAPGTLTITGPRLGALSCRVRLAAPLPALDSNATGDVIRGVAIPLIADDGLWLTRRWVDTSSRVEVSNPGDVPVCPQIVWQGTGGRVTLPSGAGFTLPQTSARRVLWLDNAQSCVVTDEDGREDRGLWTRLASQVQPEKVPVGGRRIFELPAGAALRWQVGFFDPWK